MSKPYREHVIQLALDKPLYRQFIRLQADKGLGRPYAGLLAFVEGMFHLGYLSKDDYLKYVQKYSEPLEKSEPLTFEDLKRQEQLREIQTKFRLALEQFENMPESSKQYYIKKALMFKEQIPEAKQFLEKCQKKA